MLKSVLVKNGVRPLRTKGAENKQALPKEDMAYQALSTLPQDVGPALDSKTSAGALEPTTKKPKTAQASRNKSAPKQADQQALGPDVQNLTKGPNGTLVQLEPSNKPDETSEVSDKDCNEGLALLTDAQATVAVLKNGAAASAAKAGLDPVKALGGVVFSTFSALAGAYLVATGINQIKSGETTKEKLAGASDSSWGGQIILTHAQIAQSTAMSVAAKTLGAIGGALQAGLGLHKTGQGLGLLKSENGEKARSTEKTVLGLAETATGATWALASLAVAPGITIPAFLTLALGTRAYQHRDKLAALGKKGVEELKNTALNVQYLVSSGTSQPIYQGKKNKEAVADFQNELKKGKTAAEALKILHEKRLKAQQQTEAKSA